MTIKKFNKLIETMTKDKETIYVIKELIDSHLLGCFKPSVKFELQEANIKYLVKVSDGKKSHVFNPNYIDDVLQNKIREMFCEHLDDDSEED